MHKTHADKGLVVMTVTIDKPEDRAKALKLLQQMDATGPNFLLADAEDDATAKKLGSLIGYEMGWIPHTTIIDRAGRRIWDSNAGPEMTDEQIEKKVEELLKQ
jgi:hypothetical protein